MKTVTNTKTKYISVKIPACYEVYPFDKMGHKKLPNYTASYLKKHGKKLFDILFNHVPAPIYSELLRCIKEVERL